MMTDEGWYCVGLASYFLRQPVPVATASSPGALTRILDQNKGQGLQLQEGLESRIVPKYL